MKTFLKVLVYTAVVIVGSYLAGFFRGAYTVSADDELLSIAKRLFNVG